MSIRATHTILFIAFLFLSFSSRKLNANTPKDSATLLITYFSKQFSEKKLSEKKYLDTIYATISGFTTNGIIFTNKELVEQLELYRKTIWKNPNLTEYKRNYYALLSNQAQNGGRYGEMLYYAEKLNTLSQKQYKKPSLAALTIIADYYNMIWKYNYAKNLYNENKTFIQSLPIEYENKEKTLKELVQASLMLEKFGKAIYELKDTILGSEVEQKINEIEQYAKQNFGNKLYELTFISHGCISVLNSKGMCLNEPKIINESFKKSAQILANEQVPEGLKNIVYFQLIDWKIQYFLSMKKTDSARIYIEKIENLIQNEEHNYNTYMVQKYKSRLYYEQGDFKKSADSLIKTLLISEEVRKDIVKDVNEMLYAQAKAEEQQALLIESEAISKKRAKQISILVAIAVLIKAIGIIIIIIIRKNQKKKFVNFKLNLAKNIHDETGPALLYAKNLAKAKSNNDASAKAIEEQIAHTMELIRSLSHDLKSDKHYQLSSIIEEIQLLLGKINTDNSFQFAINKKIEKNRFISNYQYQQIKSILNECITNTIKHAEFKNININFEQSGNKLTIVYFDDGIGWQQPVEMVGIGLKNMEDRLLKLNSQLNIANSFPDGYKIYFTIILR